MGKTYKRNKTESHQRKIISKHVKGHRVNTYEEFVDEPVFEICPEASGNDRRKNPEDSEEDS